MKKNRTIHEPMIWIKDEAKCSFEEFLQVAKGLSHTMIIYVSTPDGVPNSVWSSDESQVLESFKVFSSMCYFGRIQPIDVAIEYGFMDEEYTEKIESY
ncbi:MAG: hypothetical protein EOO16_00260 [Chitinophagaceae bacterium]|nr:MAG: hypothetical protein EOO16_00260 [Chitinophagaceae bacterium]